MIVQGVGRRKTSTAKAFLRDGKGDITINEKPLQVYFPSEIYQDVIIKPLQILEKEKKYDFVIRVMGGGITGQLGAIRLAISKALVTIDASARPILRDHGFLTRDARKVERKKPGLRKARKDKPFRKR